MSALAQSPLAQDIEVLQRAADYAGLIIYPDRDSKTVPNAKHATVTPAVLAELAEVLEGRAVAPRDYRLIDVEAVWLVKAAQQMALHQADGNTAKADRFRKLGEYLRGAVEVDLNNARKSLEVMG